MDNIQGRIIDSLRDKSVQAMLIFHVAIYTEEYETMLMLKNSNYCKLHS